MTTRETTVALLHVDVAQPMGQQRFESEIARALQAQSPSECHVSPISVSGLRSSLPSDLKLPLQVVTNAPLGVQHAVMRWRLRRFDLVHRMDLRLPAAPVEVVTVLDAAPLRFPDEGTLPKHTATSLRRARAVVAPSAFAADDIADALAIDRPMVVHLGVPSDAFAAQALDATELRTIGIAGPYVLHCGGASMRKNLVGLHAAWSVLRNLVTEVQLVLAGPPDNRRTDLFSGDDRVVLLGNVARPTLLGVMCSAEAVVVPSIYEGFGFPAVEAMACGTAVVAVRRASLPEICGGGALLCDVEGEAIGHALQRVLEDGELQNQLIQLGTERARSLTWEAAAEQYLSVYRSALRRDA